MAPTPHEMQLLATFMAIARKKKWTKEQLAEGDAISTRTIVLEAPLTKVGPALVKITKPADRTLTAVSYKNGQLEVAETGALETIVAKVNDPEAKAVSVARPTPCCPSCVPGSVEPASDVLLSFLNEQEHEDWTKFRAIMVTGGRSRHRYLLAHRHSRTAVLNRKICYDVDDHCVLHFHDWSVPPEEEVLATKLILEHREAWLRNEATVLQLDSKGVWHDLGIMRYKNPFGDASDGRADAALTAGFGAVLAAALRGGRASA
ncbi:MAG: hypothetical protein K2X36_10560 [Microbacteriaceae bacterium]|nr:hypothetical protein [Microbacteriaceae bacterium]